MMGSKLLGLCSRRDVDYIQDRSMKIRDVMTPLEELVTGRYPLHITEAFTILKVFISSQSNNNLIIIIKY